MQLRYVFSETGTGLRRHVSMSIALILTITVSLTLVGLGLLLKFQADKAENYYGNQLQISVFLCNQNSRGPHCTTGEATAPQKAAVRHVLETHPEVKTFYLQSKDQAYQKWKKIFVAGDKTERQIYSTVRPSDMQESYWVTLKDPQHFQGVESAVSGMDGVDHVTDLHKILKPLYAGLAWMQRGALAIGAFLLVAAVLQVGNTIRLAAVARRREIGIMRLVGASSLYISLPFLMETVLAALIGIGLSCAAIATFVQVVVYGLLRGRIRIVEWIDWTDTLWAFAGITVLGIVLTLVTTLVTTRKSLKV
ncbi:MAG TPA: permease-like cell division protein FtsX [Marmoricola sp.]|jgi:cell division transport system permease protein|nr:permease-like cell division protein FtsX [Marmoricola sp.]